MTVRVDVAPQLYDWALQRSGVERRDLHGKFPRLEAWTNGDLSPTLNQLERFARATRTPVGYFFLSEPPDERIPIPDLRTMGDKDVRRPSADLLDTIRHCQQRQAWYRDHARRIGLDPVPHVGSLSTQTTAESAASAIAGALSYSVAERGSSWSEAFTRLRDHAEDQGILVMVSGIVGSNTRRTLDPEEFRGFALVDELAPVVFVNGADTKAAQIFTLAHELAHVWLGETALSDADLAVEATNTVEGWCNSVAAETLVPLEAIRSDYAAGADLTEEIQRLARRYRTSTLVVLHRIRHAGFLAWKDYRRAYQAELERVMALVGTGGTSGNFYNTQPARVSKRFARAVIASTLEGETLYRDALQMLGFKKLATFNRLGQQLEVM